MVILTFSLKYYYGFTEELQRKYRVFKYAFRPVSLCVNILHNGRLLMKTKVLNKYYYINGRLYLDLTVFPLKSSSCFRIPPKAHVAFSINVSSVSSNCTVFQTFLNFHHFDTLEAHCSGILPNVPSLSSSGVVSWLHWDKGETAYGFFHCFKKNPCFQLHSS